MNAPVLIESDRLRFSRPHIDDATPILERYSSDPLVTRYLGWPRHQSIADAEAFIALSDEVGTRLRDRSAPDDAARCRTNRDRSHYRHVSRGSPRLGTSAGEMRIRHRS